MGNKRSIVALRGHKFFCMLHCFSIGNKMYSRCYMSACILYILILNHYKIVIFFFFEKPNSNELF